MYSTHLIRGGDQRKVLVLLLLLPILFTPRKIQEQRRFPFLLGVYNRPPNDFSNTLIIDGNHGYAYNLGYDMDGTYFISTYRYLTGGESKGHGKNQGKNQGENEDDLVRE